MVFPNYQNKIIELLKVLGSQIKAAKVLGVNQSQISRYLSGQRTPKPETMKVISQRFTYYIRKKLNKPFHKKIDGTKVDGRKFVRFEFSLWRRDISETALLPELFKKLRLLYDSVRTEAPTIKAQRLGISISTDEKRTKTKEFFSYKAKRKYKREQEQLDFITTVIYARDEKTTEMMFTDFYHKLLKYLTNLLVSPTLHNEDDKKTAHKFYVFFEDETILY